MDKAPRHSTSKKAGSHRRTPTTTKRASEKSTKSNRTPDSLNSQPLSLSAGLDPSSLQYLQSTVGNRAAGRFIQAKLTIGRPDDEYEREADRVAETVMQMPEPEAPEDEETTVQTNPLTPPITPLVQRSEEDEPNTVDEESLVQTQPMTEAESEEGDEEPVAAKLESDSGIQVRRQEDEEEEEELPAKLETGSGPDIQRQMEEGEERETIQSKLLIQRQTEKEEEAVQEKHLPGPISPRIPEAMHNPATSAGHLIQRVCPECEEELQRQPGEEDEEVQAKPLLNGRFAPRETLIQARGVAAGTQQVIPVIAANIQALNSGGSPLPRSTRSFFEPRIGADFSQVRVHTGTRAAETAKSINARAFTVGRHIAFGASQYAPESYAGRRLLAHELTHVVQQNGSQLQRDPLRGTGQARQGAGSLEPDLQPGKGLGVPGVNSGGLARRGLGRHEGISRRSCSRGNAGIMGLNFLSNMGGNIVLGSAQRRASMTTRRQVLAHDLAQVFQQSAARPRKRSTLNGSTQQSLATPSTTLTLSRVKRGPYIQRRALPAARTIARLRLGGLDIMPFGYVTPPNLLEGQQSLSIWRPVETTAELTATTEAVPVGDEPGTFPGFGGLYAALSFALHQPAITMIVQDVDPRFHVLNVTGAPRTENPINSSRASLDLGHGLRISRPVNPNMRTGTRVGTQGGWAARAGRASQLRQQYTNEERSRDPALWLQVQRAYKELAVEALSVRPEEIHVMDYRLDREPLPDRINIRIWSSATSPSGEAGPGQLQPGTDPTQQRPWLLIDWQRFDLGRDAVRSTFRHESIHTGTRERVLALIDHWRQAGQPQGDFLAWLRRQSRLPNGGPEGVTALDLQLAQAHQIGGRSDESLTAAMTFTTTFHRIPVASIDLNVTLIPAFHSLTYMLANWRSAGLCIRESSIPTLRDEILRRLRVYYVGHLDPAHQSVFNDWVDSRPGDEARIMSGFSTTWHYVRDVLRQMRQFRRRP